MYPYRACFLCAALGAGILFGPCFDGLESVAASLIGIALCHLARTLASHSRSTWTALLPLLLVIGSLHAPRAQSGYKSDGHALPEKTIVGEVAARPCGAPGESRVLLTLRDEVPEGLPAGSNIFLCLDPGEEAPPWGSRIAVSGELFVYGAPAGDVRGTITCHDFVLLAGPSGLMRRASNLVRRAVLELCRKGLSERTGGLLAAILLGDYRCLHQQDAATLKRSGLIHLCSASGLHVGILLVISLWLMRRLRLGRRAALLAQMPLLLIYAMASGLTPPIVRSALLAAMAAAAFLQAREFHLIPAMSMLALISLMLQPELLYDVSFQLTYLAAAGCVLLTKPVAETLHLAGSKAGLLFSSSVAAQSGILPPLLYHFGEISLIAPLSNLLVIPLIPAVMVMGLGGACVAWLPSGFVHGLMRPLEMLLDAILHLSGVAASQTWAVIFNTGIPLAAFWAWYPLVWFTWLRRTRGSARKPRSIALCLLLISSLVLWRGTPLRASPKGLSIIFLDVGQGDAILVNGAAGESILVDGGADSRVLSSKLRSYGVRSLDLLVLTHPHADHMGGLLDIARMWPLGLFAHNGDAASGDLAPLLEICAERHTPVRPVGTGDALQVGGVRLSVLSPELLIPEMGNDNALVIRMEASGASLLLAGDIGEMRQRELVDAGVLLASDMLKVPHHGGSSPASEEFFRAVRPTFGFIQVGADNSFGHPALSTLKYLQRAGCRVFRTDLDGDIVVSNPNGRLTVLTQRGP